VSHEEVRRTLAEYCHTVDDGRFDEFALLWAEHATVEVLGQRVDGRAAIRDWIAQAMPADKRGRHVTGNSVITVDGDRASALSDFLFYDRTWAVTAAGRYEDELVRAGSRWVFTRRTIHLS
jgi:3-phenylpropionate/cinnamic acid dioxygenase small subunit